MDDLLGDIASKTDKRDSTGDTDEQPDNIKCKRVQAGAIGDTI
jgi:hypothetical protein